MQEIRLEGNIGQGAQVKTAQSGKQYATFFLGCNEKSGKKLPDGKDEYITTWYEVFCKPEDVQHLTKGRRVQVIGKPSFRAYIDKNNQPVAHCTIQFASIYFTMPKAQQSTTPNTTQLTTPNTTQQYNTPQYPSSPQDIQVSEDDLPF